MLHPKLPFHHPSSAVYYRRFLSHLPDDLFAPCIWRNDAPPKCRLFLWETHQKKLNTNFRLSLRGADNDGLCPFCDAPEDVAHLFLLCPAHKIFGAALASTR